MRWNDFAVYVAGTGAYFPERVSVENAIAEGRYDRHEATRTQYVEVAIAGQGQASPDFAVAAARQALERSGCAPESVGLLIHAVVLHSGLDGWNSAAFVQSVLSERCVVAELRSGCDGAFVGLEFACAYIRVHREQPAAMVTAADCWPDPVFDRWRNNSGVPFGDGAAAMVVSADRGFARLLAMCTRTDPELEGLHRGHERFRPFQHSAAQPIDLMRRARGFIRSTMPKEEVWRRRELLLRGVVEQATAEAGVRVSDVEHLVLPFDGAEALRRDYLSRFGLDIDRTTWQFDRRTGHFGAGDPIAGLNHLVESGRLSPGNRIVIVSEGAGVILTAAVLEVTERPLTSVPDY